MAALACTSLRSSVGSACGSSSMPSRVMACMMMRRFPFSDPRTRFCTTVVLPAICG